MSEPQRIRLDNAEVIDPADGSRASGRRILIEGDQIRAVLDDSEEVPSEFERAEVVDTAGRTVIPGLIDGHVHVIAYEPDLGVPERVSPFYVGARSGELLRNMLHRGFTTVRDVGGADYGLARAVDEWLVTGPRIFFGGPALSQTGGHGDFRGKGEDCLNDLVGRPTVGLVCNGVTAVREAVRDEIRKGASHIKLMLGGGIASPTDRIDSSQFSEEEISAAVEEATNANIYVTGHAYTPRSIARALKLGVRCIEHGTLLDEETAALFVEHDAFLVPTLGVGDLLASERSASLGVAPERREKAATIAAAGVEMLRIASERDVQIVFGTDFIGAMQPFQSTEFGVRAAALSSLEILQSATTTAAKLLRAEDRLGRIAPGYSADLLVLNEDPLEDIGVLGRPDETIDAIIARGRIVTGG